MKRRLYLIILLAAVAFSGMAQNIGEAFYIYRNDGQFNAFFRDEVQSIEYSYEDAEGNSYDEIVTQIVTTADSIYKIPIASIDSIGFVQPETIYNSQVVRMEPLLPYIVSVDVLTVTFSSSIPSNLMPNVGDVLLHDSFESELMPEGFAGRVVQRSGQQVICESVSFEDIYEQIVCYGSYTAVNDETSNRMRLVPRKVNGGVSTAINIGGTLGSTGSGLYGSANGKLSLDLRVTFKYEQGGKPYFDLSLSPDLRITFEAGVKGSFSNNFLSNKVNLVSLPIPDTPFLLKLKGGPALKASVKASITIMTEAALGYKFGVKYENGGLKGYGQNTSKWFSKPNVDGSISGSIFAGIQTEFGIFSYGDLLSLSLEKEAGAEFMANLTEDLLNSDKYEELQNAQFDLNLKASVGVSAKAQFFKWVSASANWTLLSGQLNINSWKLVPSFQKPVVHVSNPTSALISIKPSEKLLFPVSIGIGVWDNSGNLQNAQYCADTYRVLEDWPHSQYQATFSKLSSGLDYNAYPLVKLFATEIMATPSVTFQTKAIPVQIIRFNQTNSEYSENAFANNGILYSYKYDCEIIVSLDDATDVDDWGYVYEDLDGDTVHVSLMGMPSPYTDTRYAYYRNTPRSHATIYGYAKFVGENTFYHTEKVDYPLIYDKQPEATTLGVVEVGQTTAKVKCGYKEAAPWGGVCGIEYWEDTNTNNSKKIYFETAQEEIEILLTDLNPGKDYYYQAFIMIGEEFIMAEEIKSFTTTPHFVISSGEAINIETSSATLVGTIENEYPADERVKLAFFYSTDEDVMNSVSGKSILATYNSNGMLTANISGLNDFTTYYYTLAVKWDDEEFVPSNIMSFKTNPMVTTIENPEATVVSATLQGTCSKGINITGFSIKKDGDTEYTQYSAEVDGEGNFSTTIDGLDLETKYYYYAFVQADGITYKGAEYSFTTKPLCPNDKHPHMIDLGLPSGKKWACCNIGATTPEGYGDYYAWGETSPKSHYDWTNYIYGTGEDGRPEDPDNTNYTKYCNNSEYGLNGFSDGKVTLEESDDAATVNWGNGWRMPLMNEQQELVEKCDWSKVSLNGIKGRLVVGPSKKAIFLPAAGFKYNYYPNDTGEPGVYGHYWSASIDTTVPANNCQAADMNFQNDVIIEWRYYRGSRCAGESVRAVHE